MSDPILGPAADATEDAAMRLGGRDLGTANRDRIVAAGLVVAFRLLADLVDNGPTFPMPPSIISALIRERADQIEAEVQA
jgi:hypothetical protein